jgi:chromate transporter
LLTFGGAYTVIPFLQHDAVEAGGWMTNGQFLDGLALSGIIPAPLIIFATFVGYLGGGPWGGLALTVGIFLPAFAFTLVGHNFMEKLISNPVLHNFNMGVTAGVMGLIAVSGIDLVRAALVNLPAMGIFAASLLVLYRWHAKIAALVVVLGAGALGLLFTLILK